MKSRLAPPQRLYRPQQPERSVGMPPLAALLAALSDDKLELLFHLQVLLGQRPEWPGWAMHALSDEQIDAEFRSQFARLLERAWPTARGSAVFALRHVAARFRVPLPEAGAHTPLRRTRSPAAPGTDTHEDAALSSIKAGSR